ncbi:MAG: F0F1 ATP synthase subunit B [Candidatus Loosdrechtia sp.]|uniref:F0F1 ATP synthase subunit B n=1 Tax=Candidatus Loosdrechtia sp. TaxID=3101272 RepID=UPI003A763687|nr:MAG: F0F1 ATP synthase subunit B [Candidatus Jettenia sp. AMX2]
MLNTLGINIKSIIIQGTGFIILLFVLKKFLFGKISAVIQARADEVRSTYEKTEKDRAEAERFRLEYEKKLSDAEAEATARIQEAINKGNRMSEDLVKHAKEEIESMRVKAQESIEQERKKALTEIKNQVVTLSMLASSRIIKQSISQKTAEDLVDELIKDIGELRVR